MKVLEDVAIAIPDREMAILLSALTQLRRGDASARLPLHWEGVAGRVADVFNDLVEQNAAMAAELSRLRQVVGKEGKLKQRASLPDARGFWGESVNCINALIDDLVHPTSEVARVIGAVAQGDLSKSMALEVEGRELEGEFLRTAKTINKMVEQLSNFSAEVTRVAREVGTEGRLGGQAQVRDVSGTWKDLTENVNFMAGNLTGQVRGIAKVVTAVANGDLKQKLMVEAKGEIAALAETINSMTDTLATFADQVTTVAREVGVEGKLGGQAKVPGAAGTWKGLTENVNQLAANLTTQVRAIAEVATAVTQGDLTRSITVKAQGEVAALKDTINEMIRNLKDTTQKNTEQDWLNAKFSRMLQGQKDLLTVGQLILSELAPVVGAQQAEFYAVTTSASGGQSTTKLKLFASYASGGQESHGKEVELGQGLVGQCAIEKQKILLTNVPSDAFRIATGFSEAAALDILVLPIVFEGEVRGVLELASLERFNPAHQAFLDQLTESIGIVINTISANMRTEDLLKQSQSLAEELQNRQQELQTTNEELQEKARLLVHQNQEVERKSAEVEQARQALEEKAEQLALTSKYKSEFLANMSHELRTPLNSLLILSDQLCKNAEGNLSGKQVEFAKTIHLSGNDLLALINDILDLSKIESGTVVVDVSELRLEDLQRSVDRSFRHVAENKHVEFEITAKQPLPKTVVTDVKRLQQIIKNLLSNAFKFTHQGSVGLSVSVAEGGWSRDNEDLNRAAQVIAFSVSDTGIGISPDKQQIIFEAFQQADGSTSRKYGGTGLGLTISRELARLLGGEIRLVSVPSQGSTFTLYLPQSYSPSRSGRHGRAPNNSSTTLEAVPRAELLRPLTEVQLLPAGNPRVLVGPQPASDDLQDPESLAAANPAHDDRGNILLGDKVLLIVENDLAFAGVLLQATRQVGFKGLVSTSGAAALAMTRDFQPSVITLDIFLPDMEGWRILERLKSDLTTRHIPICVVSTDESRERALQSGAVGFLTKPLQSVDEVEQALGHLYEFAERRKKRLLVMLAPSATRDAFLGSLDADTDVVQTESAAAAHVQLRTGNIDCMVTDGRLADFGPEDVIEALESRPLARQMPIVLASDDPAVTSIWGRGHSSFALRRAATLEHMLDSTVFFLHRGEAALTEQERLSVHAVAESDRTLEGRKVLIVDDDMRNIFALATVLDAQGMVIVSAENGRDAIRLVENDPEIDIVLMDIMMPEMDGMETMRQMRRLPRGKELPLIAVTAKAMKGDREKCIDAGAWDYLSKPVDTAHLLVVLRGWLLCR